jgi:hypothetical protein
MAIQVQDKRRKVGVVLTFLIGLFVTACSMVRLKYLSQVSKITNATYDYTQITLWSGIESEVGVICACMPTIIGPLLYFLREKCGSKISSLGRSSAGKSAGVSYIVGDERVTRLPSTVGEHELEMNDRATKHNEAEKNGGSSTYQISYERSSDDNVKLLR